MVCLTCSSGRIAQSTPSRAKSRMPPSWAVTTSAAFDLDLLAVAAKGYMLQSTGRTVPGDTQDGEKSEADAASSARLHNPSREMTRFAPGH